MEACRSHRATVEGVIDHQIFGIHNVREVPNYTVYNLTFLAVGGVLFILIGLQLPNILESISGEYSMMSVVLYAALICLAVIGTRLLWTFRAPDDFRGAVVAAG